MDKKQIVERLRHMVRIGDAMNACRTESNNVLAAAADLLEADGWVSVGERLPERGVKVDAWGGGQRIPDAEICDWMGPRSDWAVKTGLLPLGLVTHWRPRPTPPGGDHD